MITQFRLKYLLKYDDVTGVFTWISPTKKDIKIGQIAGGLNSNGYWRICIDRKSYKAHRLAWLYIFGYFPKELDHINRIKSDNRICNLRDVSHICNMHNQIDSQNNSSTGIRGVGFRHKKYYAQIQINKQKIHLGFFENIEDASNAYIEAKRIYQPEAR